MNVLPEPNNVRFPYCAGSRVYVVPTLWQVGIVVPHVEEFTAWLVTGGLLIGGGSSNVRASGSWIFPPLSRGSPLIAPLEVSLSAFGAPSEQAWVYWSTNGVESEPQTSKLPLRLAPPFAPMSPWPLGVWFLVTAYIPPLLESQLSTMPLVKLLKPMTPHPVPVAKSP